MAFSNEFVVSCFAEEDPKTKERERRNVGMVSPASTVVDRLQATHEELLSLQNDNDTFGTRITPNFCFFESLTWRICALCVFLKRGHVAVVGPAQSGKRSCACLAARVCGLGFRLGGPASNISGTTEKAESRSAEAEEYTGTAVFLREWTSSFLLETVYERPVGSSCRSRATPHFILSLRSKSSEKEIPARLWDVLYVCSFEALPQSALTEISTRWLRELDLSSPHTTLALLSELHTTSCRFLAEKDLAEKGLLSEEADLAGKGLLSAEADLAEKALDAGALAGPPPPTPDGVHELALRFHELYRRVSEKMSAQKGCLEAALSELKKNEAALAELEKSLEDKEPELAGLLDKLAALEEKLLSLSRSREADEESCERKEREVEFLRAEFLDTQTEAAEELDSALPPLKEAVASLQKLR